MNPEHVQRPAGISRETHDAAKDVAIVLRDVFGLDTDAQTLVKNLDRTIEPHMRLMAKRASKEDVYAIGTFPEWTEGTTS